MDHIDKFDWKFYCNYYGDLRAAGINTERKAIDHYLQHGKNENRIINMDLSQQLIIPSPGSVITECENLPSKSFFEVGQQLCNYFSQIARIQKNFSVLEIGCGAGSLALAFSKYLSGGSYYGIDNDRNCIDWCRSKIALSYSHAHFHCLQMESKHQAMKLPYDNKSMDFVFSTALFSSLNSDDIKIYLMEMSRVLKDGGKCIILYFLWNPFIAVLFKENRSGLKIIENLGEYRNICNSLREKVISFSESNVIQWHENNKLSIEEIIYGSWSSNSTNNFYQDIVVSIKK